MRGGEEKSSSLPRPSRVLVFPREPGDEIILTTDETISTFRRNYPETVALQKYATEEKRCENLVGAMYLLCNEKNEHTMGTQNEYRLRKHSE